LKVARIVVNEKRVSVSISTAWVVILHPLYPETIAIVTLEPDKRHGRERIYHPDVFPSYVVFPSGKPGFPRASYVFGKALLWIEARTLVSLLTRLFRALQGYQNAFHNG
jgi:hypothetical protein